MKTIKNAMAATLVPIVLGCGGLGSSNDQLQKGHEISDGIYVSEPYLWVEPFEEFPYRYQRKTSWGINEIPHDKQFRIMVDLICDNKDDCKDPEVRVINYDFSMVPTSFHPGYSKFKDGVASLKQGFSSQGYSEKMGTHSFASEPMVLDPSIYVFHFAVAGETGFDEFGMHILSYDKSNKPFTYTQSL